MVDLKRQHVDSGCSTADAAGLFNCSKSEVATRTKRVVMELGLLERITSEDVKAAVKTKKRGGARQARTKMFPVHIDYVQRLLTDPLTNRYCNECFYFFSSSFLNELFEDNLSIFFFHPIVIDPFIFATKGTRSRWFVLR